MPCQGRAGAGRIRYAQNPNVIALVDIDRRPVTWRRHIILKVR